MQWLWHGPAAAAPIGHLAWELPYAAGMAIKKKKKKKKKELVSADAESTEGNKSLLKSRLIKIS